MARGLGGMHGVHDLLGHVVALRVHHVLGGVVLRHEAEGVDAHLQLHGGPADARILDLLDELGREMQARCRRRGRVLLVHGVDRLVLLGVALVLRDVGRQGHVARLVDGLIQAEPLGRREPHDAAAAVGLHEVENLAREDHRGRLGGVGPAGTILDHGARLQALARVHLAFPDVAQRIQVLAPLEEQRLGQAARLALVADQAGRHHAGLVGDEQVARLQIVEDVVEMAVVERAVPAMQHEQAAGVARLRRLLSDQLLG